jgi:hypothetical protein
MISAIKAFFAPYATALNIVAGVVAVVALWAAFHAVDTRLRAHYSAPVAAERDAALALLKSSKEAAATCSASVDKLAEAGKLQHEQALAAIDLAAKAALGAEASAKRTLASQPKYPADLCRSAREANDEWLKDRRKRAK